MLHDIIELEKSKGIIKIKMYTPSQERALERMLSGESLYIAGAAGVGKSYLLQEFIRIARERGKNVLVTAPTGIAAVNVGGSTIHRAIGSPKVNKKVYAGDALVETDVFVVDEISMCRVDLFDHVVKKIDNANEKRREKGRKDIQLICVGDFAQLPPVVPSESEDMLDEFFGTTTGYAFEHERWDLPTVQLTEIVRQRDPGFAQALNQIRLGDDQGLEYINSHCAKTPQENGIWVLSTNGKVDARNREEIDKLEGKRKTYTAYTSGNYTAPTDKNLTLVEGCRVVSLTNQSGVYNGSLGTVLECNERSVKVSFDNGVVADLEPYKWETKKPKLVEKDDGSKELMEETIGIFQQIPLRAAYAVTVHKSQGQTYSSMNANPHCFADGQLYVELSRAENLENLYLTQPASLEDMKTSKKVIDFYKGSAPVTVYDVDFSIEEDHKEDQGNQTKDQEQGEPRDRDNDQDEDKIVLENPVMAEDDQENDQDQNNEDRDNDDKTAEVLEESEEPMPKVIHITTDTIQSEPEPKKQRRRKKMNYTDRKEVASDTITARVTPETKEAYERVLDSMEGDSKTAKFKNLVKAVGEANTLTAKTGSDREDYETFLLYTTRIAESYNELLKKKSELSDQIRLEFQSELSSKDIVISDLRTKVVEKEDQVKSISEDKKELEDQIKSLEMVAKEVETAKEKAQSAEESLKDSRMVCATLQEKIIKLEEENAGYDDLKAERDNLEREKEKVSERLEERIAEIEECKAEIEEYKKKVLDLESKCEAEKNQLEAEKDARKQDQAEYLAELSRKSIDAVEDKDAAVKEARAEERQYWQDQVEKIQAKLDQEREKHDKEREELDNLKIAELEKQIAALTEEKENAMSKKEEVKEEEEEAKKD